MLVTALAGAAIALSFAAPPGPVAMETIRRGLRGGFGPAMRVQLGSIIGDMTWCSVALLGLAPLAQVAWLRVALGVSGVALLVTLGGMGIRDSFKMPMALTAPVTETKGGSFRSGLAISMANPMAVGYWLSVGGALVAAGVAGSTPAQTASFVAGFLGGTFAWAFVMALAVRWGKPLLAPVAFRAITFLCGATMLVFGFGLASQTIGNLL